MTHNEGLNEYVEGLDDYVDQLVAKLAASQYEADGFREALKRIAGNAMSACCKSSAFECPHNIARWTLRGTWVP